MVKRRRGRGRIIWETAPSSRATTGSSSTTPGSTPRPVRTSPQRSGSSRTSQCGRSSTHTTTPTTATAALPRSWTGRRSKPATSRLRLGRLRGGTAQRVRRDPGAPDDGSGLLRGRAPARRRSGPLRNRVDPARGSQRLHRPAHTLSQDTELVIAGVRLNVFYSGGEAISEFGIHLPDQEVVVIADEFFTGIANLHSIRGSKPRLPDNCIRALDRVLEIQPQCERHGGGDDRPAPQRDPGDLRGAGRRHSAVVHATTQALRSGAQPTTVSGDDQAFATLMGFLDREPLGLYMHLR